MSSEFSCVQIQYVSFAKAKAVAAVKIFEGEFDAHQEQDCDEYDVDDNDDVQSVSTV